MGHLSGMTGFARVPGRHGDEAWTWEARSVNGKGLDIRLRMPAEFSALDGPIRKAFGQRFSRGNIQLSLNLSPANGAAKFSINEALIDALESFAMDRGGAPELGQLMQVDGVVTAQASARPEAMQKEIEAALLASAEALADELKSARDAEGAALSPLLGVAVESLESLCAQAESLAALQPAALKSSLQTKLQALLGGDIPEEKLAQEAAMLALKADVREELDRLAAHCAQARELMAKGSPVGRKLDFLSQEFNRETNTLCAKSSDIELTRIGLELKTHVEQFREQAANVE